MVFEKYISKKQAEFESRGRDWEIKTFGMSYWQYVSEKKIKFIKREFEKPIFVKQFLK